MSSTGRPPTISAASARARARAARASPVAAAVEAEDIVVVDERAGTVAIRIYRPSRHEDPLPTLIYARGADHGAGGDELARALAVGSGVAVALPDHSSPTAAAPPAAVERCYAAAAWAAGHGHARGLDGGRLAVGGDATGAVLAIALALLASERGGPSLACQLLLCPVVDSSVPEVDDLPPALVITADGDAACGHGEAYAARLRAAGVTVIGVRYQGVGAGFLRSDPPRELAVTGAAIEQAAGFLASALATR